MKKKIISIFFCLVSVAVMCAIFIFSSESGEESAQVSGSILDFIFGNTDNEFLHFLLRKTAHFSEYAALGFFSFGAIYTTFNIKKFYYPLIFCFVYAISDEIHQYFVPERSCQAFDVLIDTTGAFLGIIIMLIIINIYQKKKNRVQKF